MYCLLDTGYCLHKRLNLNSDWELIGVKQDLNQLKLNKNVKNRIKNEILEISVHRVCIN